MYQDNQFAVLYRCLADPDLQRCPTGRSYLQIQARTPQLSNVTDVTLYHALVEKYAPLAGLDPLDIQLAEQICKSIRSTSSAHSRSVSISAY